MNLTFISAGAGSGKTYKLTEIISQAVESGVSPERIIATTFTNKASDEIRERVTEDFFKKGDLVMVQQAPPSLSVRSTASAGNSSASLRSKPGFHPACG